MKGEGRGDSEAEMYFRRASLVNVPWLSHGDGGRDGRLATTGFPNRGITNRQKGQAKLQGTFRIFRLVL